MSKHFPDLGASLCGGLITKEITLEQFERNALTYEEFVDKIRTQKSVVTDPNLVVRLHDKYLTWAEAAPILLSVMFFKQPLPDDAINEILKDCLDVNINLTEEEVKKKREEEKKSWFGWLSGSIEGGSKEADRLEIACQTEEQEIFPKQVIESNHSSSSSDSENEELV